MTVFRRAEDPISSETHFWGAVLSLAGSIILAIIAIINNSSYITILSVIIFGVSAVLLYSASSFYHFYAAGKKFKTLFRKVDHSMIYVLIAGTYTPICIGFMELNYALKFLTVIWLIALTGILTKIFWLNAPRTFYTILYLLMGWAIVFDVSALSAMPSGAFGLLLAGGISYSIGAVFYILKWPNISNQFGFHELFHLFIMGGTLFHFLCVAIYVI